jgi:gluconate 2-dehydrogenase alpha chain
MATRLKEVDVLTVGLGWTGTILARELTKAGLNAVALERGPDRIPGQDFILPAVRDELRYAQRLELMWDNSIDTLTFRNFSNEQALPIRRIGAFLPGEGVGGSGIHWGALHWRFLPSDFRIRSALAERYGAGAVTNLNRSMTASTRLAALLAKPAICAGGRSTAATCSRGRATTNIRMRRSNRVMPA